MTAGQDVLTLRERLYVGGEWLTPADGIMLDVLNPATEEAIGAAALAGPGDIDRAARAARYAFEDGPWPRSSPTQRAAVMQRAGELIAERAAEFSHLITLEVGSPHRVATSQPLAARALLDWYAAQAESYAWEEQRQSLAGEVLVRRVAVGVVAAIVPWNYPVALAFPKLAPALLTGCSIVLKPAEETPLTGYLIADVFEAAGLPPGVLNVVPATRTVSETLVRHPEVDKVSFTGSTRAGRRIGAICGEQIKRCTLELGGKSAAILLPDVDLDRALPLLAPATMANNGQTCLNQTRVLAPTGRYDEVLGGLRELIGAWKVGDPADPEVEVGPLITETQRSRVERSIDQARTEGARIVLGGGRPQHLSSGYFVEPTILAGVDNAMTVAREEIFGPVVAVIPYRDDDEAVAIANDSPYGLSGSVWSADTEHALTIARRIRSGNVAVNQHRADLAAPLGGFRKSGIGREWGREGIDAYAELQAIPLP